MMRRYLLVAAPALAVAVTLAVSAGAEQRAGDPESVQTAHTHEHGSDAIADLVANARTAEEHNAVARWFEDEANGLDQQIARHQKLASIYRTAGAPKGNTGAAMANHCMRIVKDLTQAAEDQRELAAMHHEMAKEAGR